MSGKDSQGNDLLPGWERTVFSDRARWDGPPKGHFSRDPSNLVSGDTTDTDTGRNGGSRRRRPSRKYKKSSKRVFRKKSRSTRRR